MIIQIHRGITSGRWTQRLKILTKETPVPRIFKYGTVVQFRVVKLLPTYKQRYVVKFVNLFWTYLICVNQHQLTSKVAMKPKYHQQIGNDFLDVKEHILMKFMTKMSVSIVSIECFF